MKYRKLSLHAKLFSQEILLYSGQFALFYLLMQFIIEGTGFLHNASHLGLLAALLIQTMILSKYGNNSLCRVIFSFFVPIVYSLIEMQEGTAYLLNAAHIGFWIYAMVSSILMVLKLNGSSERSRVSESVLVIVNVVIFIFLYFYFDTWKEVTNKEELTVFRIFHYSSLFLRDPTHWFIIYGGAFLAMTVALGRNEIALLKERIYALFGKYVDGKIRDLIIEEGTIESRRLDLCILFSDIKNFTSLCETNDPRSITEMLNMYFEQWNVLVEKHHGIVDKYIGDAIMVIFGLSNNRNACNSAILCGIEMDQQWEKLTGELMKRKLPIPAGFGIGCHYGDVILGDIGSYDRKNFTVIGDTVNIASRLEAASRQTKSRLLISSAVYDRLTDENMPNFYEIGMIELKGKQEGINTWAYSKERSLTSDSN